MWQRTDTSYTGSCCLFIRIIRALNAVHHLSTVLTYLTMLYFLLTWNASAIEWIVILLTCADVVNRLRGEVVGLVAKKTDLG